MAQAGKTVLVLGDLEDGEGGEIIVRGHILKAAINSLQTGPYQRSPGFSHVKTARLQKTIEANKISNFPDIILGMRGHHFDSTPDKTGIILKDPVYIIDGVQRVFSWRLASDDHPDANYAMGCKVHLNTTEKIEAIMFRELNTGHTSMAPSVILRNEKENSRVAAMLYGLSQTETEFALKKRIAWDQVMTRSVGGDLLRGAVLLHLMRTLHAHKLQNEGTSRGSGLGILAELKSTDNQIDGIGLMKARYNLITFFDAVDQAWGIRNLIGRTPPLHMAWGWLNTFARIFSDHTEFWKDNDTSLVVAANPYINNMKNKMDPTEPEFARLARGNKDAREILYDTLRKRMNRLGLTNRYDIRRKKQRAEDRDDRTQPRT